MNHSLPMTSRNVTFVLILIIAAFLRLWDLHEIPPGLYHDEAINANQAREAWRAGAAKMFYPENNGREGLFINIQALSLAALGDTPFAARLPSALFGILTVLGVFFLTKELLDTNPKHQALNPKQYPNFNAQNFKSFGVWNLFRIWDLGFRISRGELLGLFSSFFLATSFWHINFSRIGFRAIMAPFFLVWAFYFLWKFIKTDGLNAKRSTLYATIGGLLFGLGFHSYIAYRVAPLLLIIPFFVGWQIYKSVPTPPNPPLVRGGNKGGCVPCLLALFLFFAFIAALPLGLYFLENPADFVGRSSQVSIFSSEAPLENLGKNIVTTIGMFFWHGDYNWRHNFAGSPQLWWPIGALFLIGILTAITNPKHQALNPKQYQNSNDQNFKSFGVWNLFRIWDLGFRISMPILFLYVWLLIFLLPVVLSNEGLPHALRALPLVIPAVIFAAMGLEWLVTKINTRLVILLFVFFAAIAMHGFNQYFLRWANNPHVYHAFNGSYADLGRYLNTLPQTTQKYVIVNTPGHMLVDNIPMPAQTVMFFTDDAMYVPSSEDLSLLPSVLKSPTVIAMLEHDPALRRALTARYPKLQSKITEGGLIMSY